MKDLEMLVTLRNGYCRKNGEIDIKGNREFICFLYRLWGCCYYKDFDKALKATLYLNKKFEEPLTEDGVVNSTNSAEKASVLLEEKI